MYNGNGNVRRAEREEFRKTRNDVRKEEGCAGRGSRLWERIDGGRWKGGRVLERKDDLERGEKDGM